MYVISRLYTTRVYSFINIGSFVKKELHLQDRQRDMVILIYPTKLCWDIQKQQLSVTTNNN